MIWCVIFIQPDGSCSCKLVCHAHCTLGCQLPLKTLDFYTYIYVEIYIPWGVPNFNDSQSSNDTQISHPVKSVCHLNFGKSFELWEICVSFELWEYFSIEFNWHPRFNYHSEQGSRSYSWCGVMRRDREEKARVGATEGGGKIDKSMWWVTQL